MPATTHLAEVGSTNDWLLERVDEFPDGHWLLADRQTAGRGRRGRGWSDGAGNLMASVLVMAAGPVQQLSFVMALALREALVAVLAPVEIGDRLCLKWPNDLLLDGLKVSGILLERAGAALVIGVGMNIASHPAASERPAISLAAAGLPVPAAAVLQTALAISFAALRAVWEREGFGPIRSRWLAHAAGLGQGIIARLGDTTLEGVFENLAEDGALSLRQADGRLRAIHAGEVFAL